VTVLTNTLKDTPDKVVSETFFIHTTGPRFRVEGRGWRVEGFGFRGRVVLDAPIQRPHVPRNLIAARGLSVCEREQ